MPTNLCDINHWARDLRLPPFLRVGVIINVDRYTRISLEIPNQDYQAEFIHDAGAGKSTTNSVAAAHSSIVAEHHGDSLNLIIGKESPVLIKKVRLSPTNNLQISSRTGIIVRDVIAGRGFHWEKRIDQILPGVVEILPGSDGLVLVNEIPLEDYLAGVITSEMSGGCPEMLLKAQCIVARSWLLAMSEPKHGYEPFDRCNDDCCQRYQGIGHLSDDAIKAVRDTYGLVLLDHDGHVVDANYSKCCGGVSESPTAVWGTAKGGISTVVDAPPNSYEQRFLPVTEDNLDEFLDGDWLENSRCYCSPARISAEALKQYLGRVDEVRDYFRWSVSYGRADLEVLLVERLKELSELSELCDMRVTGRGASGRASGLDIVWKNASGVEITTHLDTEYMIRDTLHRNFLYSSAITLRFDRDNNGRITTATIRGAGWGHGVGLCQIGALGMALDGKNHEEICTHYYPDARLESVYGES